jgi:hypothetical protein
MVLYIWLTLPKLILLPTVQFGKDTNKSSPLKKEKKLELQFFMNFNIKNID